MYCTGGGSVVGSWGNTSPFDSECGIRDTIPGSTLAVEQRKDSNNGQQHNKTTLPPWLSNSGQLGSNWFPNKLTSRCLFFFPCPLVHKLLPFSGKRYNGTLCSTCSYRSCGADYIEPLNIRCLYDACIYNGPFAVKWNLHVNSWPCAVSLELM